MGSSGDGLACFEQQESTFTCFPIAELGIAGIDIYRFTPFLIAYLETARIHAL